MRVTENPWRGAGIAALADLAARVRDDAGPARALLARCPRAAPTPLLPAPALARAAGVAAVMLKDERARMGLGSFKALGAAHVIAAEAMAAGGRLPGRIFVAASAGNHGLSVAAGARAFGAEAVIVLAETVPEAFARRLSERGARVVRAGAVYEESMAAAVEIAAREGGTLLSDSSWPGYLDLPAGVMEGYLILAAEAAEAMGSPPTHILLQAGVGGLAAAVAAHARRIWGDLPRIVVVEPEAAPALAASIAAGRAVVAPGPVSCMGRLDCKEPSILALASLARDADAFALISETEAEAGVARMADLDLATTPSGGAGVAALLADARALGAGPDARILAILSETA
ncbi:MAG: pyridoxal-phosphate dependent enzyme [Gemmobacter sp.]